MVIVCREIKVPGSGRSTVARLKLEGIDGKSPSGAGACFIHVGLVPVHTRTF